MLARLTFWLVPLSFFATARNRARSASVNSTIYFFFMAISLSKGSLPGNRNSANPNF